ncbi:uncharacterized protein Triagg1_10278 [Trichoderma aggressivum f. europaeum]|uniref:Uncharacterized protein n=1 Tax=Trichoderma aggressivum f. europaeum TaxID=173218 RepID=A0AAE1LY96_9HYPO|nr:hypothetical protein Triagg1_10278 [Trichoderma aggressivum f. europaeum]
MNKPAKTLSRHRLNLFYMDKRNVELFIIKPLLQEEKPLCQHICPAKSQLFASLNFVRISTKKNMANWLGGSGSAKELRRKSQLASSMSRMNRSSKIFGNVETIQSVGSNDSAKFVKSVAESIESVVESTVESVESVDSFRDDWGNLFGVIFGNGI